MGRVPFQKRKMGPVLFYCTLEYEGASVSVGDTDQKRAVE